MWLCIASTSMPWVRKADDRFHLTGKQNKVTRDRCFASARWLEVDGRSSTHRGRNLHRPVGDLLQTRNGELQDPSIYFSGIAESLLDLTGVEVDGLLRSRWRRGRRCRSLRQSNCSGKRTR